MMFGHKKVQAGKAGADIQDPLPENNWFWRRVFVFACVSALLWLIWIVVERLAATAILAPNIGIKSLETTGKWLIGLVWSYAFFYLLGASGEHVIKVIQAASLLKSGVTVTQTAEVTSPEGSASTDTTVGRPADEEEDVAPRSNS